MLKTYSFTNSEVKESLLILAFSFLMREYLTVFTLGFVCLGCALVISKIRPSKKVRNSLALVIFASYWWSYGKVIDPEVGLNFLTTVTMLKLLEKVSSTVRFMPRMVFASWALTRGGARGSTAIWSGKSCPAHSLAWNNGYKTSLPP
jgi:hypothetical protein